MQLEKEEKFPNYVKYSETDQPPNLFALILLSLEFWGKRLF